MIVSLWQRLRLKTQAVTSIVFAAFLAGGCATNNVAVEPLAVKPVSPKLMRAPDVPKCELRAAKDYAPQEVISYAECWRAAYDQLFAKHKGLVQAVSARQKTAQRAAKAAKS